MIFTKIFVFAVRRSYGYDRTKVSDMNQIHMSPHISKTIFWTINNLDTLRYTYALPRNQCAVYKVRKLHATFKGTTFIINI